MNGDEFSDWASTKKLDRFILLSSQEKEFVKHIKQLRTMLFGLTTDALRSLA